MNIRTSTAVTALALAAVATTSLTACGGGSAPTHPKAAVPAPPMSHVAAVVADSTPLAPGDYRLAFEGDGSGDLVKVDDADCHYNDGFVDLNGQINGIPTELELINTDFTRPGTYQLHGDSPSVEVSEPNRKVDYSNSKGGTGTVTYSPDGKSGSLDVTLPRIDWETAQRASAPPLHFAGRWSCGPGSTED